MDDECYGDMCPLMGTRTCEKHICSFCKQKHFYARCYFPEGWKEDELGSKPGFRLCRKCIEKIKSLTAAGTYMIVSSTAWRQSVGFRIDQDGHGTVISACSLAPVAEENGTFKLADEWEDNRKSHKVSGPFSN